MFMLFSRFNLLESLTKYELCNTESDFKFIKLENWKLKRISIFNYLCRRNINDF